MRMYFYASELDIANLLEGLGSTYDFQYVMGSWLNDCAPPVFENTTELSEHVKHNDKLRQYFVGASDISFTPKELKLNNGDYRYSINHGVTPDSIRILFGSKVEGSTILQSTIDGFCETEHSKNVFKKLKRFISNKAIKQSGVLFLPEAYDNLKNGWRLTPILTGVPELDVKLEPCN